MRWAWPIGESAGRERSPFRVRRLEFGERLGPDFAKASSFAKATAGRAVAAQYSRGRAIA